MALVHRVFVEATLAAHQQGNRVPDYELLTSARVPDTATVGIFPTEEV